MKSTAILLIDCPDRKGIVATVGELLYRHNGNILHADQHQDAQSGLFLMRVEWELAGFALDLDEFAREFAPIAERFGMHWRIERSDRPHRVAVFVSRYDHCLVDLLWRWQRKELEAEIVQVASNHSDFRGLVEAAGIPYGHIPV